MFQSISTTFKSFNDGLSDEIDDLVQLRDEIRLRLHLARMDLRTARNELEKHVERLDERFGYEGDHVVETTRLIAAEVGTAVSAFKDRHFPAKAASS
jgi:hypothetical protein